MGENNTAARITGQKIGNVVSINYIDRSRKIAGDRWQIELVGEMEIPITETLWTTVSENDADLADCIRKTLGDRLRFSVSRIRNFVADDEKQAVFNELVSRFEENLLHYIDTPDFVQKLFMKNYHEARQKCVSGWYPPQSDPEPKEDEGPTDFSDLFK